MTLTPGAILFELKKALKLSKKRMLHVFDLADYPLSERDLAKLLKKDSLNFEALGVFLDGLIAYKRGRNLKKPENDAEITLTYNLILKKLRIALELHEHEVAMIFAMGGSELSKQQIKALFRSEAHKNFKACDENRLKAFLDGLSEFYYESYD